MDHWREATAADKEKPLSALLTAADSTVKECLTKAGLNVNACAQYHFKGSCNRKRCNLTHRPQDIPADKARHIVDLLRIGAQKLNQS